MTRRDPRDRSRRYDADVGRRELYRWTIWTVRLLAVPTALLSLLLLMDVVSPGDVEEGIVFRRAVDARWLGPDGYAVSVGWSQRAGCLERDASGRQLLYTVRPGCSGTVEMRQSLGGPLARGDTLHVIRTPVFDQVRAIEHRATGQRDGWYPLVDIGIFVLLGFIPLLSFGRNFAVYSIEGGGPRYHLVYVLPSLTAEALYVWLAVGALLGG